MNDSQFKRKPVAHYFIKPGLQLKLSMYFVVTSLITSFGSLGLLFLLVRLDLDGLEGLKVAWYYLVHLYPGFFIAAFISLIVSFIVGLYAARKVALPIYKVEQWAQNLREGNLNAPLGMRGNDYWKEMAEICNGVSEGLKNQLQTLNDAQGKDEATLRNSLKDVLSRYKY